MKKENVLFAIIGLLFGVIVGYVFATKLNQQQQGQTQSVPAIGAAGEAAPEVELPADHPPLTETPAPAQDEETSAEAALIEKAQAAPDDFDAQMQAAAVHYRHRRFDQAIELLTRANQLRPDEYQPLVALGNANFDSGRYESAEKWYAAALVKNPRDINVRTDLGLTFLFREPRDLDRAVKEFRRSLELDPRHEQTLQNLVVALTKKGDFAEAETALGKLSEVNPGNDALPRLRADIEAGRGTSSQKPAGRKN